MITSPFHRRAILAFCLLVAFTAPVNTASQKTGPDEVVVQLPPRKPGGVPVNVSPSGEQIVLLVRTSLLTLNDAVKTGNFTVLRDRGSPSFREANSAARLSQIFSDLVSRRVDLSAVSTAAPKLDQAPVFNQETGILHIKGHFPAQPTRIDFEFLYKRIANEWVMYGLAVQAPKPAVTAQRPASAAPAPEPAKKQAAPEPRGSERVRPQPVSQKPNKEPKKKRFPWSR